MPPARRGFPIERFPDGPLPVDGFHRYSLDRLGPYLGLYLLSPRAPAPHQTHAGMSAECGWSAHWADAVPQWSFHAGLAARAAAHLHRGWAITHPHFIFHYLLSFFHRRFPQQIQQDMGRTTCHNQWACVPSMVPRHFSLETLRFSLFSSVSVPCASTRFHRFRHGNSHFLHVHLFNPSRFSRPSAAQF